MTPRNVNIDCHRDYGPPRLAVGRNERGYNTSANCRPPGYAEDQDKRY